MIQAVGHAETQALVKKQADELNAMKRQIDAQSTSIQLIASQMTQHPILVSLRIWIIDPFGTRHLFYEAPRTYEVNCWRA